MKMKFKATPHNPWLRPKRKHTAFFILLLLTSLLVLPLSSCSSRNEDKTDVSPRVCRLSDMNIEKLTCIDFSDGFFYILDSPRLYVVSEDFENIDTLSLPGEFCHVMVGNGSIFLSDKNNARLYEYEFSSNNIGKMKNEYTLPDNINTVYSASVSDSLLCLNLYLTENEDEHELSQCIFVINRKTGDAYELNEEIKKPVLTAAVNGNSIICLSGDSANYNSLFSYENGFEAFIYQLDYNAFIDNIFYDEQTGFIWYFSGGNVKYYSPVDGCERTLYDITPLIPEEYAMYAVNGIYPTEGHTYVTHYASGIIIDLPESAGKIAAAPQDEEYTLKILTTENDSVAYGEVSKLMSSLYGVEAEETRYSSVGAEDKIRMKLLAKDSDFDLFVVQSKYIDYYAKNSVFYDLSENEEITDNFSYMFDGLYELCVSNGTLCGIPLSVNKIQNLWSCDAALLDELELELPEGKITWDEFYDFAVRTKQRADERGIEDFVVYAQNGVNIVLIEYMSNYIDYAGGSVEDRTDEYAAYLDLYFKMLDEGLIADSLENKNILLTPGGYFDYMSVDSVVFPAPLLSEDCGYTVGVDILAVNPYSKHKDEAIEYLSLASSPELESMRGAEYLLKDRESYIYTDNFGNRVVFEPETNGHEIIAHIMQSSTRLYFNLDIFNEMSADAAEVRDRKMNIYDFAEKLYKKSLMITEE